jgi:hypothetical protein
VLFLQLLVLVLVLSLFLLMRELVGLPDRGAAAVGRPDAAADVDVVVVAGISE